MQTTLPVPVSKTVVPLPGRTVGGVPIRQRRPTPKRDLSVLMILLAAETVACVSRDESVSTDMLGNSMPSMSLHSSLSNGSPQQRATHTKAGRLGSSTSNTNKNHRSQSRTPTKDGVPAPHDDETTSSCGTGGDTESDETGAITPCHYEEEEIMTPTVVAKDHNVKVCNLSISSCSMIGLSLQANPPSSQQRAPSTGATLSKNGRIMAEVFSYLSWREVIQVRAASRDWLRCSLTSATICRLPNSKTRAVFVPCTQDLSENDESLEASLISGNTHDWACPMCGMYNVYSRIQCGNSVCSTLSPAHWVAKRIFLGQLRRENTVTFVQWLFNRILDINPTEALVSVENHRDRETGRGKGCAWVSINKRSNVEKLIAMHHRAFFDMYEDVEGMWIVHPKDAGALAKRTNNMQHANKNRRNGNNSSSSRTYWDWRQHAQHMPRSPIVAEATVDQESPKALFTGPHNLSLNIPRHFSVDPVRETIVVRNNPYYRCEAPPADYVWTQKPYHQRKAFQHKNSSSPKYSPASHKTSVVVGTSAAPVSK